MAVRGNTDNERGPVIVCGASAVWLNHEMGQATAIDKFAKAVRRFFSGGKSRAALGASVGAPELSTAHSGGSSC